jgi:hypothetical protein
MASAGFVLVGSASIVIIQAHNAVIRHLAAVQISFDIPGISDCAGTEGAVTNKSDARERAAIEFIK